MKNSDLIMLTLPSEYITSLLWDD